MTKILEAQDTLENFSLVLRFLAKHVLRIKLGYFRFASDFILAVIRTGESIQESGTA